MGGGNTSCYGDPLKRILVLLFQLKYLFSVNLSYVFDNVTCCETASYPPVNSQLPEGTTLLIAFPSCKVLKTNTGVHPDRPAAERRNFLLLPCKNEVTHRRRRLF